MKQINMTLLGALLLFSITPTAQAAWVNVIDPMEQITHILGSAQMDSDPAEEIVIFDDAAYQLIIVDSLSGDVDFDSSVYNWNAVFPPGYNRAFGAGGYAGHNYGTDIFVDEDGDGIFCAMVLISEGSIYQQQVAVICLERPAGNSPQQDFQGLRPELDQNHPNPFNPTTQIDFYLASAGRSVMKIYDVRGNLVRTVLDEALSAGNHSVVWDGTDDAGRQAASGAYFYQLEANGRIMTEKSLLVK